MKRVLCGIVLVCVATSAQADRIGENRAKKPEFTAEVSLNLFDVERCVIENNNIGKPWVYRQPDRPEEVMLAWESREFGNTTVLEMKGLQQIKLRFWGKNKIWDTVLECIGRDKGDRG